MKFVNICNNKGLKVFHGDCCDICFIDNTFDYAISIAVYHYVMASNERRINAAGEMIRILKKGGKGLFSVWSVENQENEKKKRNFKPKIWYLGAEILIKKYLIDFTKYLQLI